MHFKKITLKEILLLNRGGSYFDVLIQTKFHNATELWQQQKKQSKVPFIQHPAFLMVPSQVFLGSSLKTENIQQFSYCSSSVSI